MRHVNLAYIRAAIEENTGVYGLSLEQVREYLIEEKLLTRPQAMRYAHIFGGYDEFYQLLHEAVDVGEKEFETLCERESGCESEV